MMYYHTYDVWEDGLWLIANSLMSMPVLLSIAGYVLTSLALYSVARRRGLRKPWLSWIPVANCWLLGSLSDQYRYVVHGQHKSKRKILLILRILTIALSLPMFFLALFLIFCAFDGFMGGFLPGTASQILHQTAMLLVISIPLAGVSIAYSVFRFIALYDIYKSVDPDNATLFLILSILFRITEPFFLFFSRDLDRGMPPRKSPDPQFGPPSEEADA